MLNNNKPKVTVYIPSQNYGSFLSQAIESVLEQLFQDWELILIDDGSTDESAEVIDRFVNLHPDRVRLIRNASVRGLHACANLAIEAARGDYIMRLDADDYLDENALLVLSHYLDQHPDVSLVYPNYIYVDKEGGFLGIENRKKVGKEAKLLDIPAHGACTMVRKRVLKSVGGYGEHYNAQDGYELWIKVLQRYQVANITTPLFFYRQHENSLSDNKHRILLERQRIKRDIMKKSEGSVKTRLVAFIGAKNTYEKMPNIALNEIAGRPLIDYSIETAQQTDIFDKIIVTTDDQKVVEYCNKRFPDVLANIRPYELSKPHTPFSQVLYDAVQRLEKKYEIYPDILLILNVHAPLISPPFIHKAVDTLLIYNTDTVISVYEEDDNIHFKHGKNGLELLNAGMSRGFVLEREALYVDNLAVFAVWRDIVSSTEWYGREVGHIVMPQEMSYRVTTPFTAKIVEHIIKNKLHLQLS